MFSKKTKSLLLVLIVLFGSLMFIQQPVSSGVGDFWIACCASGCQYGPEDTKIMTDDFQCCCTDDGVAGVAQWEAGMPCTNLYPREVDQCSFGGEAYFKDQQLGDCTYEDLGDNICRSSSWESDCTAFDFCNGVEANTVVDASNPNECIYNDLPEVEISRTRDKCTPYCNRIDTMICDVDCGADPECDGKYIYSPVTCDGVDVQCDINCECDTIPPPPICKLLGAHIREDCAINDECKQGEHVIMEGEYSGDCTAADFFQIDAMSPDGRCDIQFTAVFPAMNGISDSSITISDPVSGSISGSWEIPLVPSGECKGNVVFPTAAAIYDGGAPGTGTSIGGDAATLTGSIRFYYDRLIDNPPGVTSTTIPPEEFCDLVSATITPSCSGGISSSSCEIGEIIGISGTYSGDCTAADFFQIDAMSADGICDIQFMDGDMSGVWDDTILVADGNIEGSWEVPVIPDDCKGKTAVSTVAALYDGGAPGTGNQIDLDETVEGSIQFVAGGVGIEFIYNLEYGFNLISSPFDQITEVIGDDECGFENGEFHGFDEDCDWDIGVSIYELDGARGYYFNAPKKCTSTVLGVGAITSNDIDNLMDETVCEWAQPGAPISTYSVTNLRNSNRAYRWWNPITKIWDTITTLEPGKGYRVL